MDVYERRVKSCTRLCSTPKPPHNDDVITSIDELLGISTEIVEVLRHGCKHFVCDALGSTECPRGRTSAARLDPLDLRVI